MSRRARNRAWRRLGRRGQVSAVATLFGLLLVVSFISNYIVYELPPAQTQQEFQHVLQVQNQFSHLQAIVSAQAQREGLPLPVTSPITLGSPAVPPFGFQSSGSLTAEGSNITGGIAPSAGITLNQRTPDVVNWSQPVGGCFLLGSGICAVCPLVGYYSYNFSGSAATLAPTVLGGNCPTFYNVTGNNDVVQLTLAIGDAGPILLQVNGTGDSVTLLVTATPTAAETINVNLYGSTDSYTFDYTAGASGSPLTINTQLVPTSLTPPNMICPSATTQGTDSAAATFGSGTDITQDLTYYNATGLPNSYSNTAGGNTLNERWIVTPYTSCAFTTFVSVPIVGLNSIVATLNNHYLPGTTIALDSGAVVMTQSGAGSVMVSPPVWTFAFPSNVSSKQKVPQPEPLIHMTFFQFFTNDSAVSGTATAGVTTADLSSTTTLFNPSVKPRESLLPVFISVTTAYPAAWINYFETANATAFSAVPTCLAPAAACQTPTPGTLVTILEPINTWGIRITLATFQLSFT